MTDFRPLSDTMLASPQISLEDIAAAKSAGVTLIINNRPDGEDPYAPQGEAVENAAAVLGLNYIAIPVGHAGFSEAMVDQMVAAMEQAEGTVLAYCRSGTRSTLLWALAEAKAGADPEAIAAAAMAAGYDISPVRAMMQALAAR